MEEVGEGPAAYWLGKSDAKRIEPETIARAKQYGGIWTELADGRHWLIPVAKQLPHLWGLDSAGQFCRTPVNGFAGFCETSRKVYGLLDGARAGEAVTFSNADGWQYVCQALALNYHVNEQVVSFLGLINDAVFTRVLFATLEFDIVREVEEQKKTGEQPIPAG